MHEQPAGTRAARQSMDGAGALRAVPHAAWLRVRCAGAAGGARGGRRVELEVHETELFVAYVSLLWLWRGGAGGEPCALGLVKM